MQPPPAPRRKPNSAAHHADCGVGIGCLSPLCLVSDADASGSSSPDRCVHVSCTGATSGDVRSLDIHVTVLGLQGFVVQQAHLSEERSTRADGVR